MKLRKPCKEHGRYDEHPIYDQDGDFGPVEALRPCPGGEFLADDTLIIEKVDGEWPEAVAGAIGETEVDRRSNGWRLSKVRDGRKRLDGVLRLDVGGSQ